MKTLHQVTKKIKEFEIQGANQIAIYGLSFLRDFARLHGFGSKFKDVARSLELVRPTAVVLHNCIEIVNHNPDISTIGILVKTLKTVGEMESNYSAKIIKSDSKIITYCHSGEAMSFIKHAWAKHGKRISVLACQTEPLEQGVITAKELAKTGIPVTLIGDNAIGFFIKDIDLAIVGADALRKEGLVNKIGTSLLAQAARNAKKPFYVVANSLKIDKRKNFKIEERSTSEIYRKIINKKGLKAIRIRNPAFDITPWRYVTGIITENGILTRDQVEKLL
jgi:ribose 1,5-bisphosphate isomerase